MKEKITNFFASDKTFLVFTVLTIVFMVYNIVLGIVGGYPLDSAFCVLYVFCIIGMFVTFKKHEKSAMKYLLGFTMGLFTIGTISDAVECYNEYWNIDKVWCIVTFCLTVIVVIYAILRFFLALDHDANKVSIIIIQTLIILYCVIFVTLCVIELVSGEETNLVYAISYLGYPCVVACVGCVDTKVDTFKQKRSIEKQNASE